jgi:hypothetical protein
MADSGSTLHNLELIGGKRQVLRRPARHIRTANLINHLIILHKPQLVPDEVFEESLALELFDIAFECLVFVGEALVFVLEGLLKTSEVDELDPALIPEGSQEP